MDLTTNTTTNTTTTTAAVKTPEPETETQTRIQPAKLASSSLSNGVLKRHRHHLRHPALLVTYKECLKNHAANLGGHAVDGCGEFMPSPTSTPSDPTSLKCAACGCHRNFHRREPDEPLTPPNITPALDYYQPHHRHHPPPPPAQAHHRSSGGNHNNNNSCPSSPSPPPISSSYYPSAPHMLLALSSGLSAPPQDGNNIPITPGAGNPNGRKRFRTKFTPDQKEKMLDFAEKIGWKIQKRDEDLIAEFCNEIGVHKGVLKVWMHNNKNSSGKRDQANISSADAAAAASSADAAANNGNGMEFSIHYHRQNQESNNDNKNGNHNHDLMLNHDDSVSAHVIAANGSSASS